MRTLHRWNGILFCLGIQDLVAQSPVMVAGLLDMQQRLR